MLLTLYMLQKRAPWTTYIYWKAQTNIWAAMLLSDMYGTREMCGHDSMCPSFFFFFFLFFLFFEKWWTRLGHGLCYQKKKSVTHYLSHQSPPTSSHTDLLRCQSSSHADLFFFFSSIYFSFAVPPFALIFVLFVSFFSFFYYYYFFPISHYRTCRALLSPATHVNKRCVNMCFFSNFCLLWVVHY